MWSGGTGWGGAGGAPPPDTADAGAGGSHTDLPGADSPFYAALLGGSGAPPMPSTVPAPVTHLDGGFGLGRWEDGDFGGERPIEREGERASETPPPPPSRAGQWKWRGESAGRGGSTPLCPVPSPGVGAT